MTDQPIAVTTGAEGRQYAQVPKAFLVDSGAPPAVRCVFVALCLFADATTGSTTELAQASIAAAAGVKRETTNRAITWLEDAGWIEVYEMGDGKRDARGRLPMRLYSIAPALRRERERFAAERRPSFTPRRRVRTGDDRSPVTTDHTCAEVTDQVTTDHRSSDHRSQRTDQGTDHLSDHTPPTPLAEGGDSIEGEVVDEGGEPQADPVLTVTKGKRVGLGPDGFSLARELRGVWAGVIESQGLRVPDGPDTGDGRAHGELARRLAEDGYTPEQLRTAVAHWPGSLWLQGFHDGQIRGLDFGLVLSARSVAEGLAAAANGGPDPTRAATYRQATRNPMLAAAKAIAPGGMERGPEHHPAVKDAVDAATLRWREDEYRAGREPTERMPPEMERRVVEEAVAALAVPC